MKHGLQILLLFCCSLSIQAQRKDVSNAKLIGIGGVNILDTYLSPENYRGTEIRFIDHTTRNRIDTARLGEQLGSDSRGNSFRSHPLYKPWSTELIHQGYLSRTHNRADNNNELAGMYTFSYGKHYNWHLLDGRLELKAGGMVEGNIGFLYNTRNSNNPAQARIALNLSPSGVASYQKWLGRHCYYIRYEVSVPLVGVMFSPNYGQSYYEIFNEGNYDHNIIPTTIISTPSLRQMLTLDFNLWHSTFRVGYLGDYQQAEVNHLKYHSYSHLIVLGFVKQFSIIKQRP